MKRLMYIHKGINNSFPVGGCHRKIFVHFRQIVGWGILWGKKSTPLLSPPTTSLQGRFSVKYELFLSKIYSTRLDAITWAICQSFSNQFFCTNSFLGRSNDSASKIEKSASIKFHNLQFNVCNLFWIFLDSRWTSLDQSCLWILYQLDTKRQWTNHQTN